jgi:uncharacterized membrane protein YgcG
MRKQWAVAIALAVLIFAVSGVTAQDNRSLVWERWDVVIDEVDTANNQYHVTERYEITFSGTFSFGVRDIEHDMVEDIRNVTITDRGTPLTSGCLNRAGTYCVRESFNSTDITYNFSAPITNGKGVFEISYDVIGNLLVYEGGDQLWWDAIPSDHFGYPIRAATVTITLPDGFAPREGTDPVVTYGAAGEIEVNGTEVIARATNGVGRYDPFTVRVQYPHDPNARIAAWQTAFDQEVAFDTNVRPFINIGVALISLLIGLGLPVLFFVLWQTRGRDPDAGPVPTFLSEPPSALPPAVVGTLIDERADPRDAISTLVDLAQRGYLVFEERQREGLFGLGGGREFTFKRTDKPLNDLRPYEKRMMTSLFTGSSLERSLSSLRNTFYTTIAQIQSDLYQELVREDFFKTNPNTTRGLWSALGIGLIVFTVIGAAMILPLIEDYTQLGFCIPAALFVAAAAAFTFGSAMPAKTRKGAEEAAKWKAFYEYLSNLDKYGSVDEAAKRFADYLPYAVAFGIDKQWVRRFSQSPAAVIPPWYYPTYLGGPWGRGYRAGTPIYGGQGFGGDMGGGLPGDLVRGDSGFSLDQMSDSLSHGLESISTGLTSMLDSASSAMTSRPQSSTSGSSGRWSSGGRSFSGGGGFRGGGGGGGGRSGFG